MKISSLKLSDINNGKSLYFINNTKQEYELFYSNGKYIPKGYHCYNSSDPFAIIWHSNNKISEFKKELIENYGNCELYN